MTKYRNRYGDGYEFSLMPNGNIMWTGNFKWCRWGVPNVYDKAYAKYQEDGGTESLEEFVKLVHEWDEENATYTETAKKFKSTAGQKYTTETSENSNWKFDLRETEEVRSKKIERINNDP